MQASYAQVQEVCCNLLLSVTGMYYCARVTFTHSATSLHFAPGGLQVTVDYLSDMFAESQTAY